MLKVQGSEDDAFSLSDILDGTDIVYDDFYPKQKEKSPEEVCLKRRYGEVGKDQWHLAWPFH